MMIQIDNVLVHQSVLEEKFVCDLEKCKGGCCEDGDAGAPISEEEKTEIDKAFVCVEESLTNQAKQTIKKQGRYVYSEEFGWVTPVIASGICVYGKKDEKGIIHCMFEKAYNEGKSTWKKPISCHLFPVKLSRSRMDPDIEFVNYLPRETLCSPACKLGKKLKLRVYQFLKEPLTRKFGSDFYEALVAADEQLRL